MNPRALATRLFLASSAAVLLTACATIRNGGAPDPSFDIDKDLEQLASQFKPAENIAAFYADPTAMERNRIVAGRLVLLDIRYIQFIRSLTSEKQSLDAATEVLGLTLSLAGASTSALRAKTNLAALNAGVTGVKGTADKYYFLEKTIPALVSAMNAGRKAVLVRILNGMASDLTSYPFERALVDLNEYYMAGTLSGAVNAVQADANDKEKAQDMALAKIVPLQPADIDRKAALTAIVGSLTASDLGKAKAALAVLEGTAASPPASIEDAQVRLQQFVRTARTVAQIDSVEAAFSSAKLR